MEQKSKIRILHLIDNLHHGGGQNSLKLLVENLDNDVYKPIVCVLRGDRIEVEIDTELIVLNYWRWDPRTIFKIVKICKERQIDILHPHLQKSIISSLIATYFCQSRVVAHIRGGLFRRGFTFCLYRFLLRKLKSRASIYIANSKATAQMLKEKIKINPEKIIQIYNPIDFEDKKTASNEAEKIRQSWQLPGNSIVIGFVGRLHKVKGVDILLHAFADLAYKNENYYLVLAGDGPQRGNLERTAKESGIEKRVKFLGMCSDVPAVMKAMDIGVMPSRNESFGRVAIEFMQMKVPLICSGRYGLAELTENEVTALVTPNNTPEEITRAVERLDGDEKLREKLKENGYEFSQQFGIHSHIQAIVTIYSDVIDE
ncbi:MAG: glycosyltransferase [Sedimentisphaerales bacterium]|nr:glycosyltransferase [Sedimentisphaerales bacterium]